MTRSQAETNWRILCADELEKEGLAAAADSFRQCGDMFGVLACGKDVSHFRAPAVHTCKLRFCPICARRNAAKLCERYYPALKAVTVGARDTFTFKTINLTTSISLYDPEIEEKTKKMYRAVSMFFDNVLGNGRAGWAQKSSKHYTGEGYLVAAEFGESGRKLHFHVLFFGRFIPQAVLSDEWCGITGFPVVDVRMVREGLKKGLKEVLKYISKFEKQTHGEFSGFATPKEIVSLAKVFNNMRRIRTRGLFYNLPDERAIESEIEVNPTFCPTCAADGKIVPLVCFEVEFWNKMYPQYHTRSLHLKRDIKFSAKATSPP